MFNVLETIDAALAKSTQKHEYNRRAVERYTEAISKHFIEQFTVCEEATRPVLSCSNIGKPAVLSALAVLGYKDSPTYNVRFGHTMHTGVLFESWVIAMLELAGLEVCCLQAEVEYQGIPGHVDFCLHHRGMTYVVEVKTMNEFYFREFRKLPNDDRGYLTQLSLYSKALDMPGIWVCLNKANHEIELIRLDPAQQEQALKRFNNIHQKLGQLKSLDDVLRLFKAPPPVQQLYRGKATGKWVVPPAMRWSKYKSLFYEIAYDGNEVLGVYDAIDVRILDDLAA